MNSYFIKISTVIIPGQVSKLQGTFLISVKFVPQGRPPPEGGGLSQVNWTNLVPAPQVAVHGEIVRGRLQLPLTSGAVVHKNELIRLILHYACFAPDFEVEVCVPICHFPVTWLYPKKSRKFLGNILFPVLTQYRHSGLASSRLVSGRETFGNSQTLPEWKIIISRIFSGFSRAMGP